MTHNFDFIVIGGGSAGYAAARTFCEDGGKVAVVDGGDELSGLLFGRSFASCQTGTSIWI
ncbi:MAG: FAD-binding protein [Verrucomicrobia bacterium]|nr:FAD-binding protein [Verrucomicrobiota bacterium]